MVGVRSGIVVVLSARIVARHDNFEHVQNDRGASVEIGFRSGVGMLTRCSRIKVEVVAVRSVCFRDVFV